MHFFSRYGARIIAILAIGMQMLLEFEGQTLTKADVVSDSVQAAEYKTTLPCSSLYPREVDECELECFVGSQFTVSIPKLIRMSGTTKEGTYKVNVTGDIAGNQEVRVVPDTSFALREMGGKADVTATVSQEQTKFHYAELAQTEKSKTAQGSDAEAVTGKDANGLVSAPITAGTWKGSFNFNISLGITGDDAEATTDFQKASAGLYSADGRFLLSWEDAGICDISEDYDDGENLSNAKSFFDAHPEIEVLVLDKNLTRIGEYAFVDCQTIREVVIPEGIESIEYAAFSNCDNLDMIYLPEGFTVDYFSFNDCDHYTDLSVLYPVFTVGGVRMNLQEAAEAGIWEG